MSAKCGKNGAKIICRASNQTGAKRLATAMTGAAGHEAKPCSNNNDFVLLKQKSCFELKALLQHPKCIYKALMTKRRRLRNRMILSQISELQAAYLNPIQN